MIDRENKLKEVMDDGQCPSDTVKTIVIAVFKGLKYEPPTLKSLANQYKSLS